jgi:Ion channel
VTKPRRRRDARDLRRQFAAGLRAGLLVIWPVVSALLLAMVGLGIVAGRFEGWSLGESLYFSFVSGLTIGYGDFSPKTGVGRILAIAIGACGILLTALVAAIAVKALTVARGGDADE